MRWYMPVVFAAVIFASTVLQGSTVASACMNLDQLLHVGAYGGMAALVLMALHRPDRPLSWKAVLLAVLISNTDATGHHRNTPKAWGPSPGPQRNHPPNRTAQFSSPPRSVSSPGSCSRGFGRDPRTSRS